MRDYAAVANTTIPLTFTINAYFIDFRHFMLRFHIYIIILARFDIIAATWPVASLRLPFINFVSIYLSRRHARR